MSRSKTEYLRVRSVNDGDELKLQGEKEKIQPRKLQSWETNFGMQGYVGMET